MAATARVAVCPPRLRSRARRAHVPRRFRFDDVERPIGSDLRRSSERDGFAPCFSGRREAPHRAEDDDSDARADTDAGATIRALIATPALFLVWWCTVRAGLSRLPVGAEDGIESVILLEYGNFGIAALVLLRVLGRRTFRPLFDPRSDVSSGGRDDCDSGAESMSHRRRVRRRTLASLARGCALRVAIVAVCCHIVLAVFPSADASGDAAASASASIYVLPESHAYRWICDALALFGLCVLAPAWEETLFRGVVMRTLCATGVRRLTHIGMCSTQPRRCRAAAAAMAVTLSSLIFALAHCDFRASILLSRCAVGVVTGIAYVASSSASLSWLGERDADGNGHGDHMDTDDAPGAVDSAAAATPTTGSSFAAAITVPVCIHSIVNWVVCSPVILNAT